MSASRPYVLSIAGFDPCGGAGILADCKVFEQFRCLGLAVCTSITVQVEDDFREVRWLGTDEIVRQLEAILARYPVQAIKIGILENLDMLMGLVRVIRYTHPSVFIVWDTVLAASSGFELLSDFDRKKFALCLKHVDVITPNVAESMALFGTASADELHRQEHHAAIYLKGGHADKTDEKGVDYLVVRNDGITRIPPLAPCGTANTVQVASCRQASPPTSRWGIRWQRRANLQNSIRNKHWTQIPQGWLIIIFSGTCSI